MDTLVNINELMAWDYITCDVNHARIASPFSLGDDGELLCFSITYPTENTFKLTDDFQAAMHASAFGIALDKRKIEVLNKTTGVEYAKFSLDGEISAEGQLSVLQDALLDATKLSLALSFNYQKWMPKFNIIRFKSLVGKALRASIDEKKIIIDYPACGASGHVIKFPYAIQTGDSKVFIETIATSENNSVNWDSIYCSHGRLSDVKKLDNLNKRLVILESSKDIKEFDRASSFLADVASVRTLESTPNWSLALNVA